MILKTVWNLRFRTFLQNGGFILYYVNYNFVNFSSINEIYLHLYSFDLDPPGVGGLVQRGLHVVRDLLPEVNPSKSRTVYYLSAERIIFL